jgi:hypothetical protein
VSAQKKRPLKETAPSTPKISPLLRKNQLLIKRHQILLWHNALGHPPLFFVINVDRLPDPTAVLRPLTSGLEEQINGEDGSSNSEQLSNFGGGGAAVCKSTIFWPLEYANTQIHK